ncbi:hypothetical protein HDE80_002679 [Rhodanobacter sp. A1T4]|nr:hypothetical protein [Rhodanobacter sp. A1T4]
MLLLHGVRTNPLSMLDSTCFRHAAGHAVLLIDFLASVESPCDTISFGYREAHDVYARLQQPLTAP